LACRSHRALRPVRSFLISRVAVFDIVKYRIHEAHEFATLTIGSGGKPRLPSAFGAKTTPAGVWYPKLYGSKAGLAKGNAALADTS
jgi:hypothetical protein